MLCPELNGVRIPVIRQDITDYGLRKDALICAINRVKKLYEFCVVPMNAMVIQEAIDMLKNLMND